MALLPEGFGELEGYVGEWSLETEPERFRHRLTKSVDELKLFYDAMIGRMEEVMTFLAGFPAAEFRSVPEDVRNLYRLALSFMEVSHPIDLHWRRNDIDDAFAADRVVYPMNLG